MDQDDFLTGSLGNCGRFLRRLARPLQRHFHKNPIYDRRRGGRAGGKDSGREEARPASTAQLQRCSKVVQRACVSAMCRSTSFVARVIYRGRGR